MLEFLKNRAVSASPWTKWIWYALLLSAIMITGFFLARYIAKINAIKTELELTPQRIADEQARADTATSTSDILRHLDKVKELENERIQLSKELIKTEAEFTLRKEQIRKAQTWDSLERL